MILVNGAASEMLPATDRGLAYGDGVFRTLRVRGGQPQAWQFHYRKLERDCAALAISCPGEKSLRDELTIAARQQPECVGKVIVTRGSGARGYAAAGVVQPTRIVMSLPVPADHARFRPGGIRARICTLRVSAQPALAGIKHLNRLENVLARREWDDPDIAEGILLDSDGNVIGGTMTNIFIAEKGALTTPDLRRCGVAGVTRERIFARATESGIACRVEDISAERLLESDEAFVVNSVIGVWQIRALADKSWHSGTITECVRRWLDEESD